VIIIHGILCDMSEKYFKKIRLEYDIIIHHIIKEKELSIKQVEQISWS